MGDAFESTSTGGNDQSDHQLGRGVWIERKRALPFPPFPADASLSEEAEKAMFASLSDIRTDGTSTPTFVSCGGGLFRVKERAFAYPANGMKKRHRVEEAAGGTH